MTCILITAERGHKHGKKWKTIRSLGPRNEEHRLGAHRFRSMSVRRYLHCASETSHSNSACRNHHQREPHVRSYVRSVPGSQRSEQGEGIEWKSDWTRACIRPRAEHSSRVQWGGQGN